MYKSKCNFTLWERGFHVTLDCSEDIRLIGCGSECHFKVIFMDQDELRNDVKEEA